MRGSDSKNVPSFVLSSSGRHDSHREVLNVCQAKNGLGNSQLGIDTEPLVY